jgi:hypothetical protein
MTNYSVMFPGVLDFEFGLGGGDPPVVGGLPAALRVEYRLV